MSENKIKLDSKKGKEFTKKSLQKFKLNKKTNNAIHKYTGLTYNEIQNMSICEIIKKCINIKKNKE